MTDLRRCQAGQRAQIEDETARGSRKHRRLPRWISHVPKLVLVVDFCLLLYFFAGITDVNWASPVSADLAFAVLLAAMVTLLCYGFLSFAGYRLRGYKDHSGGIAFGDLDALTRAACGAAAVGMAAIAALMFIRMRTEVLYALGSQGWVTALVIALVVAVVSLLANFLVVAIHALDGSDEVARLEVLSAATAVRCRGRTGCRRRRPSSRTASPSGSAGPPARRCGRSPTPDATWPSPTRPSRPRRPSTRAPARTAARRPTPTVTTGWPVTATRKPLPTSTSGHFA